MVPKMITIHRPYTNFLHCIVTHIKILFTKARESESSYYKKK